jgi:hypothetical protein
MKLLITLLILISNSAQALDAVVTVLETPMLKTNSYDAKVVQYLRKGDVIKVHPSLSNNTSFDHLSPGPEKIAQIKKELTESQEWQQDPLFTGQETNASLEDEFIPTLDRQGNTVYVIRDHLYFYHTTPKEFEQTVLTKDPTDYRLEEPLPKKYPIYSPSGYRGQFVFGLTQPYYESYPYRSSAKAKGYSSPIDVNITLLKQTPDDKFDRFYFGFTFNIRSFSNSYLLFNGVEAKEEAIKLGVGPYICYDAYKGVENRINLYGSINFNFFNQLNISQQKDGIEEIRNYRALSLSPRLGVQYHRKQILDEVDFVLGTSVELEPATTFQSNSAANRGDWWRSRGNDRFKTRTTFTLAGYIGFQAAY